MGFCLFEHAIETGIYFAVNPAQVAEIVPGVVSGDGRPACTLKFEIEIPNFKPIAIGEQADIQDILTQTSKIGLNKANVEIISNTSKKKGVPFMFNNASRVVLVREMALEEFETPEELEFTTASEAYMEEGPSRIFVERPGVFTRMINADGQIPMIDRD